MKWFNQWFRKKCRSAMYDFAEESGLEPSRLDARLDGGSKLSAERTTFNMYRANGGLVVEVMSRKYVNAKSSNYMSDSIEPTLYLIQDGMNIGEELNRILTFEALKS